MASPPGSRIRNLPISSVHANTVGVFGGGCANFGGTTNGNSRVGCGKVEQPSVSQPRGGAAAVLPRLAVPCGRFQLTSRNKQGWKHRFSLRQRSRADYNRSRVGFKTFSPFLSQFDCVPQSDGMKQPCGRAPQMCVYPTRWLLLLAAYVGPIKLQSRNCLSRQFILITRCPLR